MAILPHNPRETLIQSDAEYQRLAQEHSRYEAELERLSKNPYLSSEDLQEETKLKKLKLRVKDEMERVFSRYVQSPNQTLHALAAAFYRRIEVCLDGAHQLFPESRW